MEQKLREIEELFCHLEASFSDPSLLADPAEYARRMKQYHSLAPTVEKYRELCRAQSALHEALELLAMPELDSELKSLANEQLRDGGFDVKEVYQTVEDSALGTYQKIEDGVDGAYQKIENGAVNGFRKVSDFFIKKFFSRKGETVEETRKRLSRK